MEFDETVYVLDRLGRNEPEALLVRHKNGFDLVGIFFGYKNVTSPTILLHLILLTFADVRFLDFTKWGFSPGLVTNIRIINPRGLTKLSEDFPHFDRIRVELLALRAAEEQIKSWLELHYDSKNKFWRYEPFIPDAKAEYLTLAQ